MVSQNKVPEAEAVWCLEKYLLMNPSNAQNADTARRLLTALAPYLETKK